MYSATWPHCHRPPHAQFPFVFYTYVFSFVFLASSFVVAHTGQTIFLTYLYEVIIIIIIIVTTTTFFHFQLASCVRARCALAMYVLATFGWMQQVIARKKVVSFHFTVSSCFSLSLFLSLSASLPRWLAYDLFTYFLYIKIK